MLSERLTKLFTLLQCSNTDIARYIGCSPSNVSRLKSGGREPSPSSRTVARLADGIYRYADYENLLPVLCELCATQETAPEALVPSIISWLYETKDFTVPHMLTPKSKRTQALMRQNFGERLARTMALLEISNAQLATQMNVDVSLISRYRGGVYSPHGNERMAEKLSDVLFSRARRLDRLAELAALCSFPVGEFSRDSLTDWLCAPVGDDSATLAQMLLRSLDELVLDPVIPENGLPPIPVAEEKAYYQGTNGLREAIFRLLDRASRTGGELLLYSDEPITWMTGDPAFYARWISLMRECIKSGIKVRIIHSIDRESQEMLEAINDWFPLYLSGMIEPYVFRRARNANFHHFLFLHTGHACIRGFFPAEAGEERWYDYITEQPLLDASALEFDTMFARAATFLRTYPAARGQDFRGFFSKQTGTREYLLSGLPVFTMPKSLLKRLLTRAAVDERRQKDMLTLYRARRNRFFTSLRDEPLHMLFHLPDEDALRSGVRVNFAADLLDVPLTYEDEEFAEHIAAMAELVLKEKNFHLTLLPTAPFHDIQIAASRENIACVRCSAPYAAFVFVNPALAQSAFDYLGTLVDLYAADRRSIAQELTRLADSLR